MRKDPVKILANMQKRRIQELRESNKFIPYIQEPYNLAFLIPKKKGDGYLKSPIYHNANAISDKLKAIGYNDTCGLDGYLEVFPRDGKLTQGREFPEVLKVISDHYGWPCKLVDREWWYDELDKNIKR